MSQVSQRNVLRPSRASGQSFVSGFGRGSCALVLTCKSLWRHVTLSKLSSKWSMMKRGWWYICRRKTLPNLLTYILVFLIKVYGYLTKKYKIWTKMSTWALPCTKPDGHNVNGWGRRMAGREWMRILCYLWKLAVEILRMFNHFNVFEDVRCILYNKKSCLVQIIRSMQCFGEWCVCT